MVVAVLEATVRICPAPVPETIRIVAPARPPFAVGSGLPLIVTVAPEAELIPPVTGSVVAGPE